MVEHPSHHLTTSHLLETMSKVFAMHLRCYLVGGLCKMCTEASSSRTHVLCNPSSGASHIISYPAN